MYIVAYLNEYYRYPNSTKQYKLVKWDDHKYYFECGHVVFDSVFMDLIRVKTGIPNWHDSQLELFTESQ